MKLGPDASAQVREGFWLMQRWIGDWGVRKEWRTPEKDSDPRNVPELLCLMHEEISEALGEYRNGHATKEVYFTTDGYGHDKPEGIGIELADAVIRILHFCNIYGLDMGSLIQMKMEYNEKRPPRHGGKVV